MNTHPQTAGTVLQARIDRALHGGYDADFAAAGGFTFKGQSDDDDLTVELDEEDGQDEEDSYSGEDYE